MENCPKEMKQLLTIKILQSQAARFITNNNNIIRNTVYIVPFADLPRRLQI